MQGNCYNIELFHCLFLSFRLLVFCLFFPFFFFLLVSLCVKAKYEKKNKISVEFCILHGWIYQEEGKEVGVRVRRAGFSVQNITRLYTKINKFSMHIQYAGFAMYTHTHTSARTQILEYTYTDAIANMKVKVKLMANHLVFFFNKKLFEVKKSVLIQIELECLFI